MAGVPEKGVALAVGACREIGPPVGAGTMLGGVIIGDFGALEAGGTVRYSRIDHACQSNTSAINPTMTYTCFFVEDIILNQEITK